MDRSIEIRGFMGLTVLFKKRGWQNPFQFDLNQTISGYELLKRLNISKEKVEVVFVNGKAFGVADVFISAGDRVALVPPGTPGPYRVLMGFVKLDTNE